MAALGDEAGGGPQGVGAGAERGEQRVGLGDEAGEVAAGRLHPVQRDEGRLAAFGVLGGGLAEGRRIALDIEEVVGELEGEADRAPEGGKGGVLVGARLAEDRPGLGGKGDEGAGLHRLQAADRGLVERDVGGLGGEVEHLAADHAGKARGAGEAEHEIGPHGRVGGGVRAAENVEGEGEERVAGKDRRRLVEGAVNGRAAAAHVVVVHRRQVVVDEGIAVDAFDGGGGVEGGVLGKAEEAGGLDDEERAQALAAAEHGVAHGGHQPLRPGDLAGKNAVAEQDGEARLDEGRDMGEAGLEIAGRHARGPFRRWPGVPLPGRRGYKRRMIEAKGSSDERASRMRPGTGRPASRRAWLRRAAKLAAVLVALPLVLIVVYGVVPPVSTLMLGDWLRLKPVSRTWVPIEKIAPELAIAVVMSEDGQFCRHGGVDWGALRQVAQDAIEGETTRGASTIPMQTVKNLFLWPSRSYVRKGLEVPLALAADLVWSKRRMLEIYLNIAEWGPGIYGAEAAARHYFKKSAAALGPKEAARLAVTLPSPETRNPGKPSRRLAALAGVIERRATGARPYLDCVYGN